MPLGGAQTGAEPSATLPSLSRSRARPEPERRRGQTTARGPEPSGRGKPIARVWCGDSSARGGERDGAADGDALSSPSRSSSGRTIRPSRSTIDPPERRNSEDPHDGRARTESRKAIRVPQPTGASWRWHTQIMPNSGTASPAFPAAPRAAFRTASPLISPTHFHEEPEL